MANKRKIDRLESLLKSQVKVTTRPRVNTVIQKWSENEIGLEVRPSNVAFVFDATGREFLGIYNFNS
jgi:hypothetical protein